MYIKEMVLKGVDWYLAIQGRHICEHGNEPSGSKNVRNLTGCAY
jgi:hypothetical protein